MEPLVAEGEQPGWSATGGQLWSMDVDSLRMAEVELQKAQLCSNVDALDRLLHPDLFFVAPSGDVYTKTDDLDWHRTGVLRVHSLEPADLIVRVIDGVGVTVLTAVMSGELAGTLFSSRMRYTRSWAWSDGRWQVVLPHASADVPPRAESPSPMC